MILRECLDCDAKLKDYRSVRCRSCAARVRQTGKRFSQEHKKNLSIARRKRITTEETKRKMSNTRKGVPKPKSFLDKIQGSKSHLSKLTEEQVLSIRSKYEKMKVDYGRTRSCESLAKEYGLGSRTTIFRIVDKITWNHI